MAGTKFKNRLDAEYKSYRDDPTSVDLTVQAVTVVNSSEVFVWQRFGPLVIPAGTTVIVDSNLLSTFSRLDYIINFKDNPVTVTRSLKLVTQNNAGTITDMVSERMGGAIDVGVSITDDSIDAFLQIINNETFDITVTFLRAITL